MSQGNELKIPKWFIIITLVLGLEILYGKTKLPLPWWYIAICGIMLQRFVIDKKDNLLRWFIIAMATISYGLFYKQINLIIPEWYVILCFVVLYGFTQNNKSAQSDA